MRENQKNTAPKYPLLELLPSKLVINGHRLYVQCTGPMLAASQAEPSLALKWMGQLRSRHCRPQPVSLARCTGVSGRRFAPKWTRPTY